MTGELDPSWQRLADLTPSMMAYWGADLRCRLANRAYLTWFGVTPEALIGRSLQDLLGPTLFALNEPYVRGALRGEVQRFERVVPGPDGVKRHSLAVYLPDIVDGEVRGFMAQVTEVTPLKEDQARLEAAVKALQEEVKRRQTAEESLAETQQSLAVALDSAGAGFIATGRDGLVTRLNAVAERIVGWTEAEARGRTVWDVYKREGRPPDMEQLNPIDVMLRDGVQVTQSFKVTAVSRGGVRTPIDVNAGLMRDPAGSVLGMAMVLRDLTEQQRAADAELRAQVRFRQVVEAAPNGFLMVDRNRLITLANRKAEELFGYTRDELVGRPIDLLVPERMRAGHVDQVAGFLGNPTARAMGEGRDLFARRRDGTEVPVEISLTPVETSEGSFTLASIVDITRRKTTEDELRRSNADLEQFAYIASHDLQEPLRMVASFTELLGQRYRGKLDEKADQYIFYAVDGARRMQQLVKDLLAYSRVGSQGRALGPVDTQAVVARVLESLRPAIAAAKAKLVVAPLPQVLADEGQLVQLFQNLIGNALKFRGDAPLTITVKAVLEDERWRFSVADTGIGLEEQYAERIFQMFQRLHERGKYEGSGIGLAIVKRIVDRHGGRVWVESKPGEGATFCFTLRAVGTLEAATDVTP